MNNKFSLGFFSDGKVILDPNLISSVLQLELWSFILILFVFFPSCFLVPISLKLILYLCNQIEKVHVVFALNIC